MDILVTRPATEGEFHVARLDAELKGICPKIKSVTVSHHYDPYAVFVHVGEALSSEERLAVEAAVQAHTGGGDAA